MSRTGVLLKDLPLLIAAAVALIALISINHSVTAPSDYQFTAIGSMHGKLVHFMSYKGYSQYVFKNLETGEFKRLHNLFTYAPDLVKAAKDQTVELSYLGDQLLDCRVVSVNQCTPRCNTPAACEALKMEVATRGVMQANIMLATWIIGFCIAYGWRLWRRLAS